MPPAINFVVYEPYVTLKQIAAVALTGLAMAVRWCAQSLCL